MRKSSKQFLSPLAGSTDGSSSSSHILPKMVTSSGHAIGSNAPGGPTGTVDIERNDSGLGSETGGNGRKNRSGKKPEVVKKRSNGNASGSTSSGSSVVPGSGSSTGTRSSRSSSVSAGKSDLASGGGGKPTSSVSKNELHICEDCDQAIEEPSEQADEVNMD